MICQKCENENIEEAIFCKDCGSKLINSIKNKKQNVDNLKIRKSSESEWLILELSKIIKEQMKNNE